ncbi:MAG: formate dehydrogenase-N subunit alpha [Anaerolineae bacterium]
MKLSRRGFIGASAATLGSLLLPRTAAADEVGVYHLRKPIGEKQTICPYCSVGCGLLIATDHNGHIINSEGDPDHIINRGALDPKSLAVRQLANSNLRLRKPLYRAPGASAWREMTWEEAIPLIARRIKDTRDNTFEAQDGEVTVNRTRAIAFLGGAANNNEDCYLASKLTRALGLVYVEHQARLCHSSTVSGLANTYGRGAMTNHWIDLKNSDCVLAIGGNPAENHPASMGWINKARLDRGAKLLAADPRFTRTAAVADLYAPLRPGTDIAFLGGMINYVLENDLYHKEYVANYTNASFLIHPDYRGPAELDGFFSGWNAEKRTYDRTTWGYQRDDEGNPKTDPTLSSPQCVLQVLKKHYARYTPEMVEKVCGTPKEQFLALAAEFAKTGQPGKAGTILYAMGQTQHTVGAQNVRAMAILQLLLGNIGIPGGGVNALRGESNVQGSTDMGVLYHILPGYLPTPAASTHPTLQAYNEVQVKAAGKSYWKNTPKFMVSLLKAFWGAAATAENDFCYDYLPKRSGDYSWISLFQAMEAGTIQGLWIMGQNPAVSGPNNRLERQALSRLKWMVVQELFDTETSSFWQAPGVDPATINTEVFLLPAADALEKAGSVATSGRLIQWRRQVSARPGQAQEDIWIMDRIYREVKRLYEAEGGAFPEPILQLAWDYGDPPNVTAVTKEINGYYTQDVNDDAARAAQGDLLSGFGLLRDDGTTCSGAWIYAGYYFPRDDGTGVIMPSCMRRGTKDPSGLGLYPNWAWVWPMNRHILYNRCSADAKGKPWTEDKALIWWDGAKWTGHDVPDFGVTTDPNKPGGNDAFIMRADLKGALFGALNEGPLPEHYEPLESPVKNALSGRQWNPVIKIWDTARGQAIGDNIGEPEEFPIVATTFRLTEHWQAGAMSRNLPWLAEAQPDLFIELSPELAAEKGIASGERVSVRSARGQITAVAMVTRRLRPLRLWDAAAGAFRTVHLVGLPWHYGWKGLATGDVANDLTPHVGDGNTMIPEYKAFLVDIAKA